MQNNVVTISAQYHAMREFCRGNYIKYQGLTEIYSIDTINKATVNANSEESSNKGEFYYHRIKPILITDFLLSRLGFEKNKERGGLEDSGIWSIVEKRYAGGWLGVKPGNNFINIDTWVLVRGSWKNPSSFISELKYIHELQNLFYLITKESLILRPNKCFNDI